METDEFRIICLETLNSFSHFKNQGDRLVFKNMRCVTCNRLVDVEIVKTSAGYGLINGNLSEPENGRITVQCCQCAGNCAKRK